MKAKKFSFAAIACLSCVLGCSRITTSTRAGFSSNGIKATQSIPPSPPPIAEEANPIVVVTEPTSSLVAIDKDFPLANTSNSDLNFKLGATNYQSDIIFTSAFSEEQSTQYQVSRPNIVDRFTQGGPGSNESETFSQAQLGLADILIVIDNSGSMAEEQANMATKLSPLISALSNANWQIAVVTTDPVGGCQRALIRKGDSTATTVFGNAIRAGTSGDGNERGIFMSVVGLRGDFVSNYPNPVGPCGTTAVPRKPWLRDGSSVAVLIVSDEDNCSDGLGCGTTYGWKDQTYLSNYLSTIRTPGVDARVYGLIWVPGQPQQTAYNVGNQYQKIITATNGISGHISSADYSPILTAISQNIAGTLKNQIELAKVPDVGTSKVFVNGVQLTSGFSVSDKVVSFQSAPAPGAQIRIDYAVGGKPVLNRLQLSEVPAVDTLSVLVNGVEIPTSSYSYDNVNNQIVYTPTNGASVVVNYKKKEPLLQSDFLIPGPIVNGSLTVKVNDVARNSGLAIYLSQGKISFGAPIPTDGSRVDFIYRKEISKKLTYDFMPAVPNPINLTATAIDINKVIGFTYSSGKITFTDPAEHREGRVIRMTYSGPAITTGSRIQLPQTPIAGTTMVQLGSKTLTTDEFRIEGDGLTILASAPDGTNVAVNYSYVTSYFTDFNLAYSGIPADASWDVSVDGVTLKNGTDYTTSPPDRIHVNYDVVGKKKLKVRVAFSSGAGTE